MKKIILVSAFFLFLNLLSITFVSRYAYAQGPLGCDGDSEALDTAIGCIPIGDQSALIGFILKWAIGIGGGIAFIMILISIFQIMTSQGNPERLKAGQELLVSAISGLILLVFSVFILQLVGVRILNIPGFSESPF